MLDRMTLELGWTLKSAVESTSFNALNFRRIYSTKAITANVGIDTLPYAAPQYLVGPVCHSNP